MRLAITAICSIVALAKSPSSPETPLGNSDSVFIERLKHLSGNDAIACGTAYAPKPNPTLSACGQNAFNEHKPFYVAYFWERGAFGHAYGLAGDSNGNVFAVNYQAFPPFPGVTPNRHTTLADDNHTRITECIKPIKLGSPERRLTCFMPLNKQESAKVAQQKPVETNICAILDNPADWNNRLVRIRGDYSGNFEYSMLSDNGCKEALWFGYGGGSGPPSLAMYVSGAASVGSEDAEGKLILPVPVTLVRDSKFHRFEKQVEAMAKADNESYQNDSTKFVGHCVTATFTGRVDTVSNEVHEFRKRNARQERSDFLGFGQMGLFEGQFVLQSVDDDAVLAVCKE
jgi:hypothetical protein